MPGSRRPQPLCSGCSQSLRRPLADGQPGPNGLMTRTPFGPHHISVSTGSFARPASVLLQGWDRGLGTELGADIMAGTAGWPLCPPLLPLPWYRPSLLLSWKIGVSCLCPAGSTGPHSRGPFVKLKPYHTMTLPKTFCGSPLPSPASLSLPPNTTPTP